MTRPTLPDKVTAHSRQRETPRAGGNREYLHVAISDEWPEPSGSTILKKLLLISALGLAGLLATGCEEDKPTSGSSSSSPSTAPLNYTVISKEIIVPNTSDAIATLIGTVYRVHYVYSGSTQSIDYPYARDWVASGVHICYFMARLGLPLPRTASFTGSEKTIGCR